MIRVRLRSGTRPVVTLWRRGELLAVIAGDTRGRQADRTVELSRVRGVDVLPWDRLDDDRRAQVLAYLMDHEPEMLGRMARAAADADAAGRISAVEVPA